MCDMLYKEIDKKELKCGDYVLVGTVHLEVIALHGDLFVELPEPNGEKSWYGKSQNLAYRFLDMGCKCYRESKSFTVTACANTGILIPAAWDGKTLRVEVID